MTERRKLLQVWILSCVLEGVPKRFGCYAILISLPELLQRVRIHESHIFFSTPATMKLFPLLLALQGGACLVFAEAFKDVSNLATLEHYNIDWIDCETFFDHFDTLARAARLPPIKSSKSYSPMVCEKVFQHYKSNPATVDALVNLANHVEKKLNGDGRRLSKRDKVEDIASHLRGTHAKQQLTTLLYKSKTPADFERRLQTAGEDFLAFDAENSGAMEIPICNDTNVANDECPHAPCVPQYLFNNNVDTFYEFIPGMYSYNVTVFSF